MADSPKLLPKIHVSTFSNLSNIPAIVGQKAIAEDTAVEYVFDGTNWIDTPLRKLSTKSSAPTITPATGAGPGASGSAVGTNAAGTITFTTGLSLTTNSDLFTIQLADGVTFPNKAIVMLQSNDPTTLSIITNIFQSVSNPGSAVIKMKGASLSVSTTYTFTYIIVGY